MNADSLAPLVPAATVVIGRDTPDQTGVEVLLLQRSSGVAFGNAWTFPGGKLEVGDYVGSYRGEASTPIDDPSYVESCRRAAVREAAEECGIGLDASILTPISHWIPPTHIARRFATWFFWAPVTEDVTVTVDGSEMVDSDWLTPAQALAQCARLGLAPPTWMTLHLLRHAESLDAVQVLLSAQEPVHYETRLIRSSDQLVALWHGDSAYDSDDLSVDSDDLSVSGGRHRLVMPDSGPWKLIKSPSP